MICSCGTWPCVERGELALARPVVVVDAIDLVCEACDTEFEGVPPNEDQPFVICFDCSVPA